MNTFRAHVISVLLALPFWFVALWIMRPDAWKFLLAYFVAAAGQALQAVYIKRTRLLS